MKNQHPTVHSWLRWLFIAFPPLAAVLFALVLTMPALAATVYNVTLPVNFTETNPCNGENIALSGNEHLMLNVTFDGSGGFHADGHVNLQDVTGVGDQGNTYHAPDTANSTFNGQVGQERTFPVSINFISTGSAPNFLQHEDLHFTINANGTLTSSFGNISAICQG